MEIRTTYIGSINGTNGIWCGFKPEEATITEERPVLYPNEGKVLVNKETNEEFSAVWLKDDLTEENFLEVDVPVETQLID